MNIHSLGGGKVLHQVVLLPGCDRITPLLAIFDIWTLITEWLSVRQNQISAGASVKSCRWWQNTLLSQLRIQE